MNSNPTKTPNKLRILVARDGKLMASEGAGEGESAGESVELTPVSENRFVVSGTAIVAEFVPATPGRPQEVRVTGVGPKPVVSQRVTASFAPSSMELRALAGEYTSAEVEGTYMLAPRDSGLVIQIPGRTDIALQPIFPDGLAGAIVGRREVFARRGRNRHGIHSQLERRAGAALRSREAVNDACGLANTRMEPARDSSRSIMFA